MNPVLASLLVVVGLAEFVLRCALALLLVCTILGLIVVMEYDDGFFRPICWDLVRKELKTGGDGFTRSQRRELEFHDALIERKKRIAALEREVLS